MPTRRATLAGSLAFLLPGTVAAQDAMPSTTLLERLIVEVIQDGDTDVLPEVMAEDATIPDAEVEGLPGITVVSIAGHQSREDRFSEYNFVIEAIAGTDDWALAYVRLQGTSIQGEAVDEPAFYTVRVQDGLISELYLGSG